MNTFRNNPDGEESQQATKQHEREVFALKMQDKQMKIDHYYQTHNRRINARFQLATITRHEDRWMTALESRHERQQFRPSDYHRHAVTMYYRKLLMRFGKDRLLRVIPKLKAYLWNPANLPTVEAHL